MRAFPSHPIHSSSCLCVLCEYLLTTVQITSQQAAVRELLAGLQGLSRLGTAAGPQVATMQRKAVSQVCVFMCCLNSTANT